MNVLKKKIAEISESQQLFCGKKKNYNKNRTDILGSDTQTGRRSRSRLRNSMARSASGSRGNQAGSAANMNRYLP